MLAISVQKIDELRAIGYYTYLSLVVLATDEEGGRHSTDAPRAVPSHLLHVESPNLSVHSRVP